MEISSTAFEPGESIPKTYTCQGDNISPPLDFKDIPSEAKSLALIMDDPDAPGGTFIHWLVWNLDPDKSGIPEDDLHSGAAVGTNSLNMQMYTGPCPPTGRHRYFFKLYALDGELELEPGAKLPDLMRAMEGRMIDKCELMGTFEKEAE